MKTAIIIPTYNERENVQKLIPQIEATLTQSNLPAHIVIVDDRSPDGTAIEANQLAKTYGNITVVEREAKRGIGSAYKEGFQFALAALECDAVIEMDADFSHDPRYIPSFISKLEEGSDVVVGSRYIEGGGVRNWSLRRRVISKAANKLVRFLLGLPVKDATSGYRAYRSTVLMGTNLSKVRSSSYAFQVEMLYLSKQLGFKVTEIPIIFVDRQLGKSKLGIKEALSFMRYVLRTAIGRII